MTIQTTLHAFSEDGLCSRLTQPAVIIQQFERFDVTQTGTGMPCYCIQYNFSDKANNAFLQVEMEETRSSNALTTTATHTLNVTLTHNGVVEVSKSMPFGTNLNHPFGVPFEDALNLYINPFVEPSGQGWNIISFEWYNFVQNGTRGGIPGKAAIFASARVGIPLYFTCSDVEVTQFVGQDGTDVQFSGTVVNGSIPLATVIFGQTSGQGIPVAFGTTSACSLQEGTGTSNAAYVVDSSMKPGGVSVSGRLVAIPGAPPTPPPTYGPLTIDQIQSVLDTFSLPNESAIMDAMKAKALIGP